MQTQITSLWIQMNDKYSQAAPKLQDRLIQMIRIGKSIQLKFVKYIEIM